MATGAISRTLEQDFLPSFTITPTPGSETIKRGVLAGFILQLNADSGFSRNVKLICSSGSRKKSECIDLPMTVKLEQYSNSNGVALAVSGILIVNCFGIQDMGAVLPVAGEIVPALP